MDRAWDARHQRRSTPPTRTAADAARRDIGRLARGARARACATRLVLSSKVFNPVGSRPERARAVARAHPPPDRREPDAAPDRSHRPVSDARTRPAHADRGDARRVRRAAARGQDPRTSAPATSRRGVSRTRLRPAKHAGWHASSGCRTRTACSIARPSARCCRSAPAPRPWLHGVQPARRRLADREIPARRPRIPPDRA